MLFCVTDAPRSENAYDGTTVLFEPKIACHRVLDVSDLVWGFPTPSGAQEDSCHCGGESLVSGASRRLVRRSLRLVQNCGGCAEVIRYMRGGIAQDSKTEITFQARYANCSFIKVILGVIRMMDAVDT